MKKYSILLAIVLLGAVSAFAGRFVANEATTTPYYWEEIGTNAVLDSVVATDSSFLFKKISLQRGCGYAVRTTDSVNVDTIQLACQVYTSDNVFIGETPFDTIVSGGTGNQYALSHVPVGFTTIGARFTIVARSWIAGKVAKVRRSSLWRYRTINTDMPWNIEP